MNWDILYYFKNFTRLLKISLYNVSKIDNNVKDFVIRYNPDKYEYILNAIKLKFNDRNDNV